MSNTMTLIGSVSFTGSQSAVVFQNVPNTYTDLLVMLSGRTTVNNFATSSYFFFNGGGQVQNIRTLSADGGTVGSGSTVAFFSNGASASANYFTNVSFYVPSYASSLNKTVLIDIGANVVGNSGSAGISGMTTNLTAAITSVHITNDGQWTANTTAYLYGIRNT